MPRESLDAPENLPKEVPCQVALGQHRKIATMMSGSDRRKSDRRDCKKFNTGTIIVFHGAVLTMPASDSGISNI